MHKTSVQYFICTSNIQNNCKYTTYNLCIDLPIFLISTFLFNIRKQTRVDKDWEDGKYLHLYTFTFIFPLKTATFKTST